MPHFSFRPAMLKRITQRIGCILGLVITLSACGYKGPLYMPPPPPAPDASLTEPPGPDNPSR